MLASELLVHLVAVEPQKSQSSSSNVLCVLRSIWDKHKDVKSCFQKKKKTKKLICENFQFRSDVPERVVSLLKSSCSPLFCCADTGGAVLISTQILLIKLSMRQKLWKNFQTFRNYCCCFFAKCLQNLAVGNGDVIASVMFRPMNGRE